MKKTIKPSLYLFIRALFTYPKLKKFMNNTKYSLKDKYMYIKPYAIKTIKSLKLKTKIIGKENIPKGNVLFVANHSNYTDFLYILDAVDEPLGFIIAKEYEFKEIPIANNWMKQFNCLFLDRSNNREGLKTIIKASEQLKDISSMCVFPEGTTNNNGLLGDFKEGAFKMAFKANVPIVPIVIKGAKDSFKITKKKILGLPICLINPKEIEIEILPPIYDHIEDNKIKTIDISNKIENLMRKNLIEYEGRKGNVNGI